MGNTFSDTVSRAESSLLARASKWTDRCGHVYKLEHLASTEKGVRAVTIRGVSDTVRLCDVFGTSRDTWARETSAEVDFSKGLVRYTYDGKGAPKRAAVPPVASLDVLRRNRLALEPFGEQVRELCDPVLTAFLNAVCADGSVRVLAVGTRATCDGKQVTLVLNGRSTVHGGEAHAAVRAGANARASFLDLRTKKVFLSVALPPDRGGKRKRDADD